MWTTIVSHIHIISGFITVCILSAIGVYQNLPATHPLKTNRLLQMGVALLFLISSAAYGYYEIVYKKAEKQEENLWAHIQKEQDKENKSEENRKELEALYCKYADTYPEGNNIQAVKTHIEVNKIACQSDVPEVPAPAADAAAAPAASVDPNCEGDCVNGLGTYTYPLGDKYVGEFKDSKEDGQGTYTYLSGDKYVGEFKYGNYNGEGTYFFANGDKYVGEYKDDKRNGQGTMFYVDGTTQAGLWQDDAFVK
jgi:hypothetical protein